MVSTIFIVHTISTNRTQFKMGWPDAYGEYDTAVFQAYKELEVKIREAACAKPEDISVPMARKAFHPQSGTLAGTAASEGEREALMHLIAGALGSYKNPHSHRKVVLGPVDAVEMIMLASHLYKIVEMRAMAVSGQPSSLVSTTGK